MAKQTEADGHQLLHRKRTARRQQGYLRAAPALAAGMVLLNVGAFAQSPQPAARTTASRQFSFNIPRQPLSSAMIAFQRVTSMSVLADGSVPASAISPGVAGSRSAASALQQMLAGTGLSYSISGNTARILNPTAAGGAAAVDGAIALDTIDVSGGSAAAAADLPYETPGSSAYISAEEISRIQPTSPGDIFKTTPGVISAGNRNGNTLELNIRGLQGMNRVATLVDGTQQTSSYYRGYSGNQSRTSVDPELLGGVSIEKGPSGGPYGAGSMGGVVNMRTLEAGDIIAPGEQMGLRIRGSIGSNSVANPDPLTTVTRFGGPDDEISFENKVGSAAAAVSFRNIDIVAAMSTRESGNYFAGSNGPTTGHIRSGSSYTTGPLSLFGAGEEVFNSWESTQSQLLKTTVRFAEDMSLELGYVRYRSKFGEYDDLALQFATFFGRMELPATYRDVDTYTAKYNWKPADNPLVDFRANLWMSDVRDDINYFIGSGVVQNDVRTWGTEIWNTSRASTGIGPVEVMYGGQYVREEADSTTTDNPNGFRTLMSAFTQVGWQAMSWLKFDAGARYERYEGGGLNTVDREDERLNPTASVTVTPLDGFQIFAKYAEGWRPPSIREMTALTPNTVINPGLAPEVAKTWEFGVNTLRHGVLREGDKFAFKAVYFDSTYEDYIIRLVRPNYTLAYPYWWDNIDEARYKGLEFSASYDAGWMFMQGAYTYYTDIQYCMPNCVSTTGSADFGANYVPPEYSGSVTLGFRAFDKKLTFGGRMDFVGSQTIASNIAGTIVAAEWSPSEIYGLFAKYDIHQNLQLGASVENLLDIYYLDAMSSTKLPAPGRTARLMMTLKF